MTVRPNKTSTKKKPSAPRPPVRVRFEPPSIIEAITAARGLTDDVEQQVEIAAGLMDVSLDEVRSSLKDCPPEPVAPAVQVIDRRGRSRPVVVVVERRFDRSAALRSGVPPR